MTVEQIINAVRMTENCEIFSSSGIPQVKMGHTLPNDLLNYYQLCGGMILFDSSDYAVNILSPQDVVLANPLIAGGMYSEDISSSWYTIGRSDSGDYITIDLHPDRLGRCYDSFHETHGVAGSCPVIALSFIDLLERLLNNKGQYWFWCILNLLV